MAGLCTKGLIFLLAGYRRFLSPALPRSCRFYPSCSAYALEALERHGASKGVRLGLARLLHCQSWNPGGYDPVP